MGCVRKPEGLRIATCFADNFILNVLGNRLIRVELHGIDRATLSTGTKVGCVAEHVAQRNFRSDDDRIATLLLTLDETTAGRDIAHDEAGVLFRSFDFNVHNGLENDRIGLLERVFDSHRTSDLEGSFRGVDLMVGTVDEFNANIFDRIACQNARVECLLDALID